MVKQSKTSQAVELYLAEKEKGMTPFGAAKWFDVNPSAVYRRLKVLAETADQRCPCCGQLVPTEK